MSYIQLLYIFKSKIYDTILKNERSGYYMMNGYSEKNSDIIKLRTVLYMISSWDDKNYIRNDNFDINVGIVEDEISKSEYYFGIGSINLLTFKKFMKVKTIENEIIKFKYDK